MRSRPIYQPRLSIFETVAITKLYVKSIKCIFIRYDVVNSDTILDEQNQKIICSIELIFDE